MVYCLDGTQSMVYCLEGTQSMVYCLDGTQSMVYCVDGTQSMVYCLDGTQSMVYCQLLHNNTDCVLEFSASLLGMLPRKPLLKDTERTKPLTATHRFKP